MISSSSDEHNEGSGLMSFGTQCSETAPATAPATGKFDWFCATVSSRSQTSLEAREMKD